MQDFGTIPGLAGCILGGAAGGGRLGGYPPPAAPVKCPRCNSTNTKFCYYNNYNLAQPRHFCKSCRRYWTKGGVLRNVPFGGGCRKSKRSSSSSKASAGAAPHKEPLPCHSDAAGSDGSAPFPISTLLASHPDPNPNPTPSFDPALAMEAPSAHAAEIFAAAGSITSLIASGSAPAILEFGSFSDPPPIRPRPSGSITSLIAPGSAPAILEFSSFSDPPPIPLRPQPTAGEDVSARPGFMDQAAAVNPRTSSAAAAGMDWPGASADPALFDLSAAYWCHGHWGDADPALYLA